MDIGYNLARPFLRFIPPEKAHTLTLKALKRRATTPRSVQLIDQKIEIAGISWPNRVGLAAGFDKDGIAIEGLARQGFGFLEIGGVTPEPQFGNPKPRLFRVNSEEAVINRMGFNNGGVEALKQGFSDLPSISPVRLGVNIARNFSTPNDRAIDDYGLCLVELMPYVDFVTINVSSPNTPGLTDLQEYKTLGRLLSDLMNLKTEFEESNEKRVGFFVKISPDLGMRRLETTAKTIEEAGCDGIVATNTTVHRPKSSNKYLHEEGGLSGRPLFPRSLACVEALRNCLGDHIAIIGVGGISSAQDALDMMNAGANLIQIYTGLVFQGPKLIQNLVNTLSDFEG